MWYMNEFLYSSGHAGTVCGAPQRLRTTPGGAAEHVGTVLGRQVEDASQQSRPSRLKDPGSGLARSGLQYHWPVKPRTETRCWRLAAQLKWAVRTFRMCVMPSAFITSVREALS